jgi:hypothetical protein
VTAVVVQGGEVSCGHPPGVLTVEPSQAVLKVGGNPVLLVKDIQAVQASQGCANTPPSLPRCSKVDPLAPPPTGSRALKVNGEPVVLESTTGTTDQKGVIKISKPGQTRLTET